MAPTSRAVYPRLGTTYPDANNVPITSAGAIVAVSPYITQALALGFLLTEDPLNIFDPEDRSDQAPRAPGDASYITVAAEGELSNERTLAAGTGISITDGGLNGPITITNTSVGAVTSVFGRIGAVVAVLGDYTSSLITNLSSVAGATVTAALDALAGLIAGLRTPSYITLGTTTELTSERVLVATAPITLTDGGANGNATLAAPTVVVGPASAVDERLARFDGTTGKLIQSSTAALTDAGTLSGLTGVDVTGNITVSGTVDGVDVSNLAAVPFVTIGNSATTSAERALTAGAGISITDGGAGGAVTVTTITGNNTQTGTTYTLVLADSQRLVNASNAGAFTLTVPPASSVAFATGTIVDVLQGNAGAVTIAPGAGVSFLTPTGKVAKLSAQNSQARLRYFGSDTWALTGELEESSQYVTMAAAPGLANERVLTAGAGISITDGGAGGAVTVAQDQVNHRAQATEGAGQVVPSGTITVLTLSTEVFDPNNNFAGNTYTVPVTGVYSITVSALTNTAATSFSQVNIYINGAVVAPGGTIINSTVSGVWVQTTSLKSLVAGNTVQGVFQQSTGAGMTLQGAQFDIHRIA